MEYREGCTAFHSPARKINTLGPSLGRRRVLLLCYYSVKTKQIPSQAVLVWLGSTFSSQVGARLLFNFFFLLAH